MINKDMPAITMMVINEVCDTSGDETGAQNIGGKKQCLEAAIQSFALAKNGFKFDSIEDAKDKDKWKEAIENKDIVPFPDIEEIDDDGTDAEINEGRYQDIKTANPIAGSEYTLNLAICTYEAAVSYENSDYDRIFQISEENELSCEVDDDGSVKGRLMKSFLLGNREEATTEDPPNAPINIKYNQRFFSILNLGFEAVELEGIYDIMADIKDASSDEVTFKLTESCGGGTVTGVDADDLALYDSDGDEVEDASFSEPDDSSSSGDDGEYTVSADGIEDGYYITTTGVLEEGDNLYEGVKSYIYGID